MGVSPSNHILIASLFVLTGSSVVQAQSVDPGDIAPLGAFACLGPRTVSLFVGPEKTSDLRSVVLGDWAEHVRRPIDYPEEAVAILFNAIGDKRSQLVRSIEGVAIQDQHLSLHDGGGSIELAPITLSQPTCAIRFGILADRPIEGRVVLKVRSGREEWREIEAEGEYTSHQPVRELQVKVERKYDPGTDVVTIRGITLSLGDIAPPQTDGTDITVMDVDPAISAPSGRVSRAQWGARDPNGSLEPDKYNTIIVHHTGSPTMGQYKGVATIRGIQDFHIDDNGWTDIGYHYLIGPEGTYYEGRPEGTLGSHAPPNSGRLGICVIGNFNQGADTPTAAQKTKLVQLLKYVCAKYGLSAQAIKGHRDTKSTDCPGDLLYNILPSIRNSLGSMSMLDERD